MILYKKMKFLFLTIFFVIHGITSAFAPLGSFYEKNSKPKPAVLHQDDKDELLMSFVRPIAITVATGLVVSFIQVITNRLSQKAIPLIEPILLQKLEINIDKIPAEIQKFVAQLENIEKLRRHNLPGFMRLLLYGPPGNGKTTYARYIAKTLNADFYLIKPADLGGSYLNDGPQAIAKLFQLLRSKAKGQKRVVLCLDELDAFARARSFSMNASYNEENKLVAQFIQELDNKANENIIIIGTTNNYYAIDKAIARRFSKTIGIRNPTIDQQKEIARYYCDYFFVCDESKNGIIMQIEAGKLDLSCDDIRTYIANIVSDAIISKEEQHDQHTDRLTISSQIISDEFENLKKNKKTLGSLTS